MGQTTDSAKNNENEEKVEISAEAQDLAQGESSSEESSKNEEPALSPEEALKEQLAESEKKYLYLYSEFETFKRRAIKERSDLIKFGWESVARDLLGVLDNLDRALGYAPEGLDKNFLQGLEMVASDFSSTLEKQGVKEIEALEKPFDPHFHEAVGQEASENHAEGTVIQEQQKGFTLHGRLLRPSKVIVSTKG